MPRARANFEPTELAAPLSGSDNTWGRGEVPYVSPGSDRSKHAHDGNAVTEVIASLLGGVSRGTKGSLRGRDET